MSNNNDANDPSNANKVSPPRLRIQRDVLKRLNVRSAVRTGALPDTTISCETKCTCSETHPTIV
jgi:hypothetical protein